MAINNGKRVIVTNEVKTKTELVADKKRVRGTSVRGSLSAFIAEDTLGNRNEAQTAFNAAFIRLADLGKSLGYSIPAV